MWRALILFVLLLIAGCQHRRPDFMTRVMEDCAAGDRWACDLLRLPREGSNGSPSWRTLTVPETQRMQWQRFTRCVCGPCPDGGSLFDAQNRSRLPGFGLLAHQAYGRPSRRACSGCRCSGRCIRHRSERVRGVNGKRRQSAALSPTFVILYPPRQREFLRRRRRYRRVLVVAARKGAT